jgi:hypothetical protein
MGLGFDRTSIDGLRAKFNGKIDSAGSFLQETANRYANSVKNLLEAVENQRNEYQSPIRKIWRRLRTSHLRLEIAAVVVGAGYALLGLIFRWSWWPLNLWMGEAINLNNPLRWLQSGIWGLIVGVVFWLVARGASYLVKRQVDRIQLDPGLPEYGTLGYFLRFAAERFFNRVIGHGSTVEDALHYGEVDRRVRDEIDNMSPTTIAKTLLEREEKHQDEEISRVRIIRIISIFIGTYLALNLKIDAAAYLNYALPGITAQINSVNFNLHDLWYVLPEGLTVGIILTGLAASAGSKFWRDLLGRLQAARGQAEEAARLVRSVKGMLIDTTDQSPRG